MERLFRYLARWWKLVSTAFHLDKVLTDHRACALRERRTFAGHCTATARSVIDDGQRAATSGIFARISCGRVFNKNLEPRNQNSSAAV
jgi:hypothetical protein